MKLSFCFCEVSVVCGVDWEMVLYGVLSGAIQLVKVVQVRSYRFNESEELACSKVIHGPGVTPEQVMIKQTLFPEKPHQQKVTKNKPPKNQPAPRTRPSHHSAGS